MDNNQKDNSGQKTESQGTRVSVVGSSILYKTDKNRKRTRFTTLYEAGMGKANKVEVADPSEGFYAYTHPEFDERPKRLDLISNHLNDVELSINGKNSNLCDISEYGFSFANKLPRTSGDYYLTKNTVKATAKKMIGKKISATFHSKESISVKSVGVVGKIRNVKLIVGLTLNEAELEFKKFLYKKAIHRNNDKNKVYEKLEYLVDLVNQEIHKGNWDDSLAVSINTTILNMMLEIGATEDAVDKMLEGYRDRPKFIRFGASVEDSEQAKKLQEFTRNITAIYLKQRELAKNAAAKEVKDQNKKSALSEIPDIPVDISFNFQKFVLKSWYSCLARFGLDPRNEILKSSNQKLAQHLKKEARAFNDVLENLPEKQPKQMHLPATQTFIFECITKALESVEDHGFENIERDIRIIVSKTFDLCIRDLVEKLQ